MREGLSVSALESVYRERSVDFFCVSLATTADPELARDAVQEGFARAIRFRGNFRGIGTPEAWVARCVVNAARDLTRVPSSTGLDEPTAPNGVEPQLVDHDLRSFIRRLPARQREALYPTTGGLLQARTMKVRLGARPDGPSEPTDA